MFLSLFLILTLGVLGGLIFHKLHIPKLVWYIILGILMSPSVLNLADESLINISSYLRQIALVIILTRSGLSLDFATLKKIGRPAILMCFVPATFEIIGVTLFGPLLLGINYFEAMLLGSVLAAVSPAIVVPRMIKLMDENYGNKHHVAEVVLAGASCDDIFVIVLFYSFKNLVATSTLDVLSIGLIPVSIILGIILGLLAGVLFVLMMKYLKLSNVINVILMLGISFGMLYLEEVLKPYCPISSLLAIIVMTLLIYKRRPEESKEIKNHYNALWNIFEILLFALVGIALDIKYAFSETGGIILGLILISLAFRTLGVIVSLLFTKYNIKEKIFIIFSYIPKATVQASIGAIALSEGLACGEIVLTAAIISILFTAPLGAFLIDLSYKKLLKKDEPLDEIELTSY